MTPPHYADDTVTLHHGDCIDVLRALPDNSVDSVVTDPPYGLEFMGKTWDAPWKESDVNADAGMSATGYTDGGKRLERPSFTGSTNPKCQNCKGTRRGRRDGTAKVPVCLCVDGGRFPNVRAVEMRAFQEWCEEWVVECLRVLKPGGHMLAFGGTRTYHRLACAVEDAGFEIRDSIAWLYGSGFGKAGLLGNKPGIEWCECGDPSDGSVCQRCSRIDPKFKGFSTGLKPAFEPVVVGRKPLVGTVAANVTVWGTGALNINACRVAGAPPSVPQPALRPMGKDSGRALGSGVGRSGVMSAASGRWPANVVLDEGQAAALDQQSGIQRDGVAVKRNLPEHGASQSLNVKATTKRGADTGFGGSGGASRFFLTAPLDDLDARFRYQAKAPKSERPVVDGVSHATVKPLILMRWLVRLVTPPGGVVLEPFAGSGTTVEACILEGFRCVAIEDGDEYLPLILARIERAHATVEASAATVGDLLDLDFGT